MSDQIQDHNTLPYTMVQDFMIDHADLFFDDPVQAYIYIYLKRRAGSNNKAFPSLDRIAKDCISSTTTVNRKLNQLVKKGLIFKKTQRRADGGKASNLYHIAKVKVETEIRGDSSKWFIGMVQNELGVWFKLNYKKDTLYKQIPIQSFTTSNQIPEGLEDQVQNLPPAAEQVIAYSQEKLSVGMSAKFQTLILGESKYWSVDVVKHLIDRISEDPSKAANYYKKVIDNWAKIKPTPTTAAEIIAADTKGKRKQVEPKKEEADFNIDDFLKKGG